jgi:hypothetical protein
LNGFKGFGRMTNRRAAVPSFKPLSKTSTMKFVLVRQTGNSFEIKAIPFAVDIHRHLTILQDTAVQRFFRDNSFHQHVP